jgi:hypothetical protein
MTHFPSSLRGAKRRSNPGFLKCLEYSIFEERPLKGNVMQMLPIGLLMSSSMKHSQGVVEIAFKTDEEPTYDLN